MGLPLLRRAGVESGSEEASLDEANFARGGEMDLEEANFARGLPELRAAAAISPRRSVGRAPRVGLTVACAFGKPLAPFASSLWARKLTGAPPLRLAAFMR